MIYEFWEVGPSPAGGMFVVLDRSNAVVVKRPDGRVRCWKKYKTAKAHADALNVEVKRARAMEAS